ncbi:hypothetical protein [Bacillus sp. Marseille-P3800]|uniref:hypothetical protein n=1 Tax=Bacillus sp. Marseille-P3800 TaxID=2014782 RepID=UPI000C06979A|nr:hypothetical protein [Bacillus sp. Marseille-P3800]
MIKEDGAIVRVKEIATLADCVVSLAAMFSCTFEEVWDKHMNPQLTQLADFNEVMEYIQDKIELGKGVNNEI